ncbi:uncharacterized protein LOC125038295 isoform X2 [Penaeus chinensis]|nr:uncharacterized protein LOC125038295 isoform X2 [Penaeus chinensis]XP_047487708.1 uncharacterized protein LOC125038295 isoform X2 [Penaeus chinensis]XP_047487709.1 uncharacterized protein LOC125038295 isoform X2 [Penaeus chinensis]
MSAATFASYVIGKLSGSDRVDAATSSMASRTSPTPRLTTVWRTKSIPYDVPRTEPQTFKSDGSLLKILRTKSMPSLNLEDEISGRSPRPMSPLSIGSPVSSRSGSPLPMVRSRTVNPRLDRNTVTPPPSPSFSNPALSSPPQRRRLERTTSDGALLVKRRQKRSEFENEFPSGGTPSVRALKSVFDAKSDESMTSDRSPLSPKGKWPLPSPTKSVAVVGQVLKKEPEAVTRQMKPVRHGSLEHYERAEEKKTTVTVRKISTSQPSFKEILRRFQQPDNLEKEATTLQTHKLPRETARQVNIVVEEKVLVREVQSEPKPKGHISVSRQRSKSEPEPNSKRPHVLASPVSVKRLKMQFESQEEKDSFASPMLLPPRRETTKLRKQFAVRHNSSESEDDVFDMDLPSAVKKPEPMMLEATEASSVTPSVSNLRQQFEKAASAQSFSKTVGKDDVTVRRIQWSTTQDLRAPFESAEQNKEVQRERLERPSLSEINSQNTVKNLLQQFQTTTPDQPLEGMTNKFSFETRESTHSKEVSKSDVKSYIKSYETSSSPQTRHRSLDGEESEFLRHTESSGHGGVSVQRRRSSSSSSDDSSDSQEPDELLLSIKRGSAEREQQIEDYWKNKEETLANRRAENERGYGYRDDIDADRLENDKLLQKQRLTHSLHNESEEEDKNTSEEDEARGQNIDIKEEIKQMEILVKEALTAPPQINKAEDTHSKIDTLITDFEKNQNPKQDSRGRSSSVLSEDLGLESSQGKVGHLIDKFANVRDADSDSDSSDGEGKGDGKKSSATRSEDTAIDASPGKVGHLIDKFAKVRKDSISEEDEDKDRADEKPRERRESDITSLIDKFAKINNPRVKSASTSSDSDAEKTPAAEKEKPPVPTIPTKSIPGKVRTLNPDELQFFGMGGASEPFVRSQSLRVKKADPQPFYPRGGSLRVKKSEPQPVIPAAKKLPRNCRNLKPDELRFFDMGNNNNVYGNLTSKSNSQNSSCASTPTTEKEDVFNNNNNNNNKTPNVVQFFQ